jgi:Holliday junction resolvasome RuvABC endonuclease subunit
MINSTTDQGDHGMKVIGLDLSTTQTGIALTDGTTLAVTTKDKDGDERLRQIRDAVRRAALGADLAMVEDVPKGSFAAKPLGMVHGAVRTELMDLGIPYALVVPASLKSYAIANGKASKSQLAVGAFKRAGLEFGTDDECDAWWLRHAGLDQCGQALFKLPQAQRAYLGKFQWPAGLALLAGGSAA